MCQSLHEKDKEEKSKKQKRKQKTNHQETLSKITYITRNPFGQCPVVSLSIRLLVFIRLLINDWRLL